MEKNSIDAPRRTYPETTCRQATIEEVIAAQAKRLRDEAHQLENLAEQLKNREPLSQESQQTLTNIVIAGLNKQRSY